MNNKTLVSMGLLSALALCCASGWAQNVKITPLGSHAGELCDRDRATIFEDSSMIKGRPVHLALSGRTMEFDGNAKCVAGC